jgi:hypothetical protein
VSIKAFLHQRAVNIIVGGNYTLPRWLDPQGKPRTFACRTSRVSPFRMIVDAPVIGRMGDRLTSYFRDFGKFDGRISDLTQGGFLLELEMSGALREKFSNKLTWLEMRQKDPTIPDARKDARIIPASPHSTLTFADGAVRSCFVIDMSISGAAVSAEVQPPVGTALAVGSCVGRVVRPLPAGFAVQFVEKQKPNDLERLVIRASAPAMPPVAETAARFQQEMPPPPVGDETEIVEIDA